MKIGFDASDLATNRADGTTRYTRELARRLPLLGKDHQWLFFAPGDFEIGTPLPANVKKIISPWLKYWTQARLPFDLLRYKPDVLFMPIQQLPIMRPKKMKTVAVMHDLAFHMFGKQYTRKDWTLLHAFSTQVARQADAIIAVSQSTAHDIGTYYGRTKDVHVIHHGVDLQKFHVPSEAEQENSWQQLIRSYPPLKKPYLLYVGQMQPRKNLVRLIQAFELVKAQQPDLQLVISSGHGWKQAEILNGINSSPVKDSIYMPGAVVDDLLPALYWHAQAFALVSTYEGFGMPILEALACGTPVVTSNVSSMPEVAFSSPDKGRLGGVHNYTQPHLSPLSGGRNQNPVVLVDPTSVESIAEGIKKALLLQRGGGLTNEHSWDVCAQRTWQVIRQG